jgi:hypothetical protein
MKPFLLSVQAKRRGSDCPTLPIVLQTNAEAIRNFP